MVSDYIHYSIAGTGLLHKVRSELRVMGQDIERIAPVTVSAPGGKPEPAGRPESLQDDPRTLMKTFGFAKDLPASCSNAALSRSSSRTPFETNLLSTFIE